jgi:hypothetical protein
MKVYRVSGETPPVILNNGIRWTRVVSLTCQPLYVLGGGGTLYPLSRGPGGLKCWSGWCGEGLMLSALLGFETRTC